MMVCIKYRKETNMMKPRIHVKKSEIVEKLGGKAYEMNYLVKELIGVPNYLCERLMKDLRREFEVRKLIESGENWYSEKEYVLIN